MDDELSVFLCLGLWSRYHSEAATIPSAQNKGTIWYDSYSMVQGACDFLLVSKSTLLTLLAAKARCQEQVLADLPPKTEVGMVAGASSTEFWCVQ